MNNNNDTKNNYDAVKLFIRFIKEIDLYGTIFKTDDATTKIPSNKLMMETTTKTKILLLPQFYLQSELIPKWEEFCLNNIHKKTKLQVLKEAINNEGIFNTIISDIITQNRYKSINDVLKITTIQNCIDKAVMWHRTTKGCLFYAKLFEKVNNYLHNNYEEIYG